MDFVERAVETALQKHGSWKPELVEDIEQVMEVARELASPALESWTSPDDITPLVDLERRAIYLSLIICHGDHTKVARKLGVSVEWLTKKLAQYKKGM